MYGKSSKAGSICYTETRCNFCRELDRWNGIYRYNKVPYHIFQLISTLAFNFISIRQQEMLQRAREELDRERRNLLRRRPNCEVKEKVTKTSSTRAKGKDRSNSLTANDESSNDGMKTTNDSNKA